MDGAIGNTLTWKLRCNKGYMPDPLLSSLAFCGPDGVALQSGRCIVDQGCDGHSQSIALQQFNSSGYAEGTTCKAAMANGETCEATCKDGYIAAGTWSCSLREIVGASTCIQ